MRDEPRESESAICAFELNGNLVHLKLLLRKESLNRREIQNFTWGSSQCRVYKCDNSVQDGCCYESSNGAIIVGPIVVAHYPALDISCSL